MKKNVTRIGIIHLLLVVLLITHFFALAQGTPTQCGAIFEGEFQDQDDVHHYFLSMNPGDQFSVQSEGIGDYVNFTIGLYSPTDLDVQTVRGMSVNPYDATGVLSERGNYRIELDPNTPGLYTLYVSCVFRDGTSINAGETITNTTVTNSGTLGTDTGFSGIGFPGLPPVDFSNVIRIPLPMGIPMTGAITPSGGEILGYTFEAAAGDTVDLSFDRLSGNLNLGLLVLSANNEVVFQSSLVTSQTLDTRFILPSAGQYTIGILRIDLLPPSTPEGTAFQIQVVLNP